MYVIKIGGNELDEPGFLTGLAQAVAQLDEPVVIVHGGGRAISDLQHKMGLQAKKVDGLRVTDEASLAVAQMVLSGSVNKRLVQALIAAGVPAIGISGVDGGLLRCRRKQYGGQDLGLVGEIQEVNTDVLATLGNSGFVPVVSPISLGFDGEVYNVNADEAAGAIAQAVTARRAWFISNVAAVLDLEQQPIRRLDMQEAVRLMEAGIIRDGMVPKVQTALGVIAAGVGEAIITNLEGLSGDGGTLIVRNLE